MGEAVQERRTDRYISGGLKVGLESARRAIKQDNVRWYHPLGGEW